MSRALVIVDIQNDYFPGGAHPLVEPEAAAANAQQLLEAFRAGGDIHIAGGRGVNAPVAIFRIDQQVTVKTFGGVAQREGSLKKPR